MPHKMNTRSCERVCGLAVILRGYASMAGELAGAQWNEGDVFCSVVRRVALPDAFYAIDGLFETFLTVLDDFGAYPAVIDRELRALPAVPGHHQGADGGGAGRRRPRDRARGDQGARGRGGAGHAGGGRRAQRPAGPAGRRRADPAGPGGPGRPAGGPAVVHRRGGRPGRRGRRADRRDRQAHPEAAAVPGDILSPCSHRSLGSWSRCRSPRHCSPSYSRPATSGSTGHCSACSG